MRYTDPSGYSFIDKLLRPGKKLIRGFMKMIGQKASSWLVNIGSAFCGPWYAACVAVGNYDMARAFGADKTGALKAGATAGAMAYVGQQANAQWGRGSWQSVAAQATAGGIAADLNGGKFGHGFWAAGFNAFQQGPNSGAGYGQNLSSFGDYARSFGNYMTNAYAQEELGRFAEKNGMTLTELNMLLTVNSFVGREFAGTTYNPDKNTITGFTTRDKHPYLGILWDINDTILGYQGYIDAVGFDYISQGAGSNINAGHSLGALRASNLVARGFANGANIYSLPFGNVSEAGVNTTLGMFDPVNGGALGMLLNPFALLVDSNVFPYHSCAENYGNVCAR
jgi:hypothetical protein